jgi:guanine deaminase
MSEVLFGQTLSYGTTASDVRHESSGAIVIENQRIAWTGPRASLPQTYKSAPAQDFGNCILSAGFTDPHLHFPQNRMLAAPGKDLLDWLQRYTFPEEARYADALYSTAKAGIFLERLAQHGTTSAMAFCSVHKVCADALFAAAEKRNMALVTGKTMMDRHAIPEVQDTAEASARETEELYHRWHGKNRLLYAVTPRFAITSTDAQLHLAGELMQSLPGSMMQTHLSESPGEIALVAKLFPNAKDYTDVYESFKLLSDRSCFAHGIHLNSRERARLAETSSSIIHCPTSNSFIGSGIMSMPDTRQHNLNFGLATDIGGGTSYSMLATMGEAYRLQMLKGYKPSAHELFHMATRGNAGILHLDQEIGSLEIGNWADIIVLDPEATPVLKSRNELSETIEDQLFALAILGDDRAIRATYIAGNKVHDRLSA